MPAQNFDLSLGRAVDLHLADVRPDLHAVGSGVHAESAADGAGDSDQALHSTKVMRRTPASLSRRPGTYAGCGCHRAASRGTEYFHACEFEADRWYRQCRGTSI